MALPIVEILAHTTCDSVFEAQVCKALITKLKALNKERKFPTFHRLLNEFFDDQLNDEAFLHDLQKSLKLGLLNSINMF